MHLIIKKKVGWLLDEKYDPHLNIIQKYSPFLVKTLSETGKSQLQNYIVIPQPNATILYILAQTNLNTNQKQHTNQLNRCKQRK